MKTFKRKADMGVAKFVTLCYGATSSEAPLDGPCRAENLGGPHDQECFRLLWAEVGCNPDAYPDLKEGQLKWWHTLTVSGVRMDMEALKAKADAGDAKFAAVCYGS